MNTVIFLLSGIIVILIGINGFLFWRFNKTHSNLDKILEKGKIKDFRDIFLSQKEKHSGLEKQIKEAFLKIKDLEDICERTIHKTSVVRFNPFSEMGGNQSFVIAMLDAKNNGFVISSLFIKEGNRVYTKAIKNGKSEHALSKEEQEALQKAINNSK